MDFGPVVGGTEEGPIKAKKKKAKSRKTDAEIGDGENAAGGTKRKQRNGDVSKSKGERDHICLPCSFDLMVGVDG